MFSGYFGMPEDTAASWSNGWFHSGDLGRIDSDGNVYFCGRSKDAIRRRGENISAMEIEEAVELHPDIVLCAAIGVPSEMSEEDVKICVQLRPDAKLTELDIIAHCEQTLGRFQVPRYVEIVERPATNADGEDRKAIAATDTVLRVHLGPRVVVTSLRRRKRGDQRRGPFHQWDDALRLVPLQAALSLLARRPVRTCAGEDLGERKAGVGELRNARLSAERECGSNEPLGVLQPAASHQYLRAKSERVGVRVVLSEERSSQRSASSTRPWASSAWRPDVPGSTDRCGPPSRAAPRGPRSPRLQQPRSRPRASRPTRRHPNCGP